MTAARLRSSSFDETNSFLRSPEILPPTVHLRAGSLMIISGGGRLDLRVHAGTVWLTVDNDDRDYLVQAGEAIHLTFCGRAIAQAIAGSASFAAFTKKGKKC